MLLSDLSIRDLLGCGAIEIEPLPDLAVALGACSLDLRWSGHVRLMTHEGWEDLVVHDAWSFNLQPGQFALATTLERITLPDDIAGRLEGRSSLARQGLAVHSTAGLFDPGWTGVVTLELSNLGCQPITLTTGMRICAMAFERVDQPVAIPYRAKPGNRFAGQSGPVVSRVGEGR